MLKLILFSLLSQLAIGAILPLLFIAVDEMGAFFFRLMSGIYAVLLIMTLLIQPFDNSIDLLPPQVLGLPIETISALLGSAALVLLAGGFLIKWVGKSYLYLALVTGLAGVILLAVAFPVTALVGEVPAWVRATSFTGAMLMLGTVSAAMVTGHWYLVNSKLTIRPLRLATLLFIGATVLRMIFVAALVTILFGSAQLGTAEAAAALLEFSGSGLLFWGRVLIGLVGPLVFGVMILQTVKLRNTQSATGILYATIVLVFIGEAFSRFLCFFTGIPV